MTQPVLVGRSEELAILERLVEAARLGEPAIAFVEGNAGIGKTRLLDELAAIAVERGGLVLRGSAPPPTGQPLPFAALSQLLRDVLRTVPEPGRSELVAATPELAVLQPAWRVDGAGGPVSTNLTVLCERLTDVIEGVASGGTFALVLLDDLHWADAGTLDVVSYLTRAPREAPVAIVLAARADDAAADSPVRQARAGLLRGRVAPVRLGPLAPEASAALLAEVTGDPNAPAELRQVRELAAGNPLFLTELADAARRGAPELPDTLVALVGERLAAASPGELAVLRVCAVVSEGLPPEHLARVLDAPEPAVFEAVRSLVAQGLLAVSDDGIVCVAQPLVLEIVADTVLEAERRRIHAAVARAMVGDPGADPRPEVERLVRVAEHWDAAGDRLRATPALIRAAGACEQVFAFTTAFELYGRVLADIDAPPAASDERRLGFGTPASGTGSAGPTPGSVDGATADIRRHAVDSAILAGRPDVAIGWADAGLARMAPSRDRGLLELSRARALLAAGAASDATAAYETAIGLLDPAPAAATTGLARALVATGSPDRAIEAAESAVRAARAAGSASDEAAALLALGSALATAGRVDEAVRRVGEARALRQTRSTPSIVAPRMSRVIDLSGGLAEAARALRATGPAGSDSIVAEARATATQLGDEAGAGRLSLDEAVRAFEEGRWDEALGGLASLAEHPATRPGAIALRARIAALRGAWDVALVDLERIGGPGLVRARPADRAAYATASVELYAGRRATDAVVAAVVEGLELAEGAPERARAAFVAVAARGLADALLAARALRSASYADERAALLASLGTGDAPGAGDGWSRAWRLTARAEVARADGTAPDGGWDGVRGAWEALSAPWWVAYAAYREGEAALGQARGRDAARGALVRANQLATDLEAAPLLGDIAALAARSRIDLAVAEPVPAPKAERALPISAREEEVLVLLAQGLTNKEIAAELFISEKTAAHHVEHIFDKLGVSSRVEAAGVAHQAGLVA